MVIMNAIYIVVAFTQNLRNMINIIGIELVLYLYVLVIDITTSASVSNTNVFYSD
jgi:hypothetical protein